MPQKTRTQPPPAHRAARLGSARQFAGDLAAFAGFDAVKLGLLMFLGAFVEGIGIVLLVPLLSVVLGTLPGGGWVAEVTARLLAFAPGESAFARIAFLLALFGLLLFVRAIVILRRDVAMARLETGFIEEQRLRLVGLLCRTRWDILARLRHGRVTHVLGGDMQAAGTAAYLLLHCLVSLTVLAGQLVLAFLLSPLLALLILLAMAAGVVALRPVFGRARSLGERLTLSNMGLVASTAEFLGGLKLALSQNLQRSFLDEFGATLTGASARRVAFARQRAGAQIALTSVAALLGGLVVLLGIGVLHAPAPTVIAFLFVLGRMNGPAAQVQNGAQTVFHSLPAYEQIKALQAELLQRASEPAAAAGGAEIAFPLVLRDVGFSHDGGEAGVFGLDLTIDERALLGVSGASGAGKTTLADLLVGLYPPARGTISLGGRPLEGAMLAAWREAISYVSQDAFLFHDTLRRNLLWARPGAGDEELWEALDLAGATAIVERLEGRLEAVLGERGGLLSGGERQRIALARALLRKPRLLLLDEATSAIDLAGEREILERLLALPSRPAIVIIAHRAESLAFCERVIELRHGRLVAAGADTEPLAPIPTP